MNRFLDLNKVAFTTYGSSMTLVRKQNAYMGFEIDHTVPDGYYFHPIYDGEMFTRLIYTLSFQGTPSIEMEYDFRPEQLTLSHGGDEIKVCFPDRNILRFAGHSKRPFELKYEITRKYDAAFAIGENKAELNVYTKKNMLYVRKGKLIVDAPWDPAEEKASYVYLTILPENDEIDFSLEEFSRAWTGIKDTKPFEEYVEECKQHFLTFCEGFPAAKNAVYDDAFECCAYMSWAYIIYENGYFGKYRTILLSKNWMAMSASWDNAFNLVALSETNQQLAFEQLFTLMDYQEDSGIQPDWLTSHRFNHSYVKPPVQGSVLRTLMRNGVKFDAQLLKKTCFHLEKIIDFWFRTRDCDNDGIPEYQHGNDSGADNCTVFDIAPNVEGPDLTAYLIADMDFLADFEASQNNHEKAKAWKERADKLFEIFMKHSYDAERGKFVSKVSGTHEIAEGDALLDYLPLLLSYRLDPSISRKMIEDLKTPDRFLTEWSLASESVSSAKYSKDSYWRGPIWAPQVFFIVEGMREFGEEALAKDIAQRFVRMCMEAGCFAENHNALTGEGLRDTSYSWCSNVFVYFANMYCA